MNYVKYKHNLSCDTEKEDEDREEKAIMQSLNLEWDDYQGYIYSEELH